MSDTIAGRPVLNMKSITQDLEVIVESHERTPSLAMTCDNAPTKNYKRNISKRSFVAFGRAKGDPVPKSRLYEGRLIVNGFHPQLSNIPTTYCPSKELLNALPRSTNKKRAIDERILNMVKNCQENEQTEKRKRQRLSPLALIPPRHRHQNNQDGPDHKLTAPDSLLPSSYADSFMKSNVPQMIVNIGGRGVSCNTEFLKVCGASSQEPSSSFTLFNLIAPSMRFKLFEILSHAAVDEASTKPSPLSAPDDNPRRFLSVENNSQPACAVAPLYPEPNLFPSTRLDEGKKTHMSITLPCIALPVSKLLQNVTIILMDDNDLDNRCFLCILSPVLRITSQGSSERPPGSIGSVSSNVQRVCSNKLLNLLQPQS